MRWLRAAWRHRWALWCGAISLVAGAAFVPYSGLAVGALVVVVGFLGSYGMVRLMLALYGAGILRGR